jgi:transposase-like protein
MKETQEVISSALSGYYEGMSLNGVSRHLGQLYNRWPSSSTVYYWVTRFTPKAIKAFEEDIPNVGDEWYADETFLKIGGAEVVLWDIIDKKTRFLLATHMSLKQTKEDAQIVMERAAKRAGKSPRTVTTDALMAYIDGIENAFGRDTRHIISRGMKIHPDNNLLERFHGSLKDRTRVMRGMKTPQSANLILQGWLIHYNYFRPHEGIGDRTPAQVAGIKPSFTNWAHIVALGNEREHIEIPSVPTFKIQPTNTRRYKRVQKRQRKNERFLAKLKVMR